MDEGAIVGTALLTEEDLAAGIRETSWLLQARKLITGIFAAVVAMGIWGTVSAGQEWYQAIPVLALPVGVLVAIYGAPRFGAHRMLRAIAKAGDANVSYRFDAEGVTIRTAGATATFAYRVLAKVIEGKTAFLLYTGPFVANIVPKRAFSSQDVERVRAYIAAHVQPRKAGRLGWKILGMWVLLIFAFVVVWQFLNAGAPPPR